MDRYIVRLLCLAALAAVSLPAETASAEPPAPPLTIQRAVSLSARNYPAIRASLAEIAAAGGGVELAKTAYLPHADMRLAVNRATRNNVFGLFFPNDVIP